MNNQKNNMISRLVVILVILFCTTIAMAQFPQHHDLYVVDIKTGEVFQGSSVPDAGEFNPSWSPNGKKIAHDVVGGPAPLGHAIYITDVRTGVSNPLAGADGGNDAAWSANGRKIAFDRVPMDDSSTYVLPPSGGIPKLVAEDAVDPDWSPNSKRLVFHRPSDGSIRSVNENGLSETFVAYGGQPVWSPNGQWIAFVEANNIWKIRVNMSGEPLDSPIQITTMSGFQPSWSNNSKTIVFHSNRDGDADIWTISASGGAATRLTGIVGEGDFDPSYSKNGCFVAYSGFTEPPLVCELGEPGEHDYNEVRLLVVPDGRLARNDERDAHGIFPSGTCDQYIFAAGPFVGGLVNGVPVVAGAPFTSEFVPSEIGTTGEFFRVFNSSIPEDVQNWPPEFSRSNGRPIIIRGPQNLVVEYNDVLGTPTHSNQKPLGIEIRQRSLAYDDAKKSDAVIFIWEINNLSSDDIIDAYFCMWADHDIGDWMDDRASIVNDMAVIWDDDFLESNFSEQPAIMGFDFLETPNNAAMVNFSILSMVTNPNAFWKEPHGTQYDYLRGALSIELGETVGDVRFLVSAGPFDIEAGANAVVAGAILFGRAPEGTTALAVDPVILRPDPNDPVLAEVLQMQEEVQTFYDRHLRDKNLPKTGLIAEETADGSIPEEYSLSQNYPNPFNPTTTIRFDMSGACHVIIKVYDILGHEVKTLVDDRYQPGSHSMVWDGKDDNGLPLASGTYLVRMQAGEFVTVKRILLLK